MKKNYTFLTAVVSVLLASTLLLIGAMSAVALGTNEGEKYEVKKIRIPNIVLQEPSVNVEIEESPIPQTEMEKKFFPMSTVNKQTNTITLFTKEFLDGYWQQCLDGTVIHSLSVEEVLYIIQNSIELFFDEKYDPKKDGVDYFDTYDKIVIPSFEPEIPDETIAARIPSVEGREYAYTGKIGGTIGEDYLENMTAIYDLTVHRIKLLSSPDAFITEAELREYAGVDYSETESDMPKLYYIPGYNGNTADREALLRYLSGESDTENIPVYFDLTDLRAYALPFSIGLITGENKETVFPTWETAYTGRIKKYYRVAFQ